MHVLLSCCLIKDYSMCERAGDCNAQLTKFNSYAVVPFKCYLCHFFLYKSFTFFLFCFIGRQLKSIIIMVPLYISIVEARMHELPKSINQLFPFLIILRVASCICFCSHYQLNKWMNNLIIINHFILFLVKIIFPDTIKIWLVSEASAAGVSQVCDLM